MKTIGFVDYYLDEWHANNYPEWIKTACENLKLKEEYKVKYAWAELESSPSGVTTEEWCKNYGVEKCQTIEELCTKADYILVLAPSNPETHLRYAKEVLKHRKRTYIDKTFAPDYATAKEIFDLGEKYGTPFFSTSALRYATELNDLKDPVSLIITGGGGNLPEYIIHQVEMAVKLLDCKPTRVVVDKVGSNQYISRSEFEGGKTASFVFSPTSNSSINMLDKNDYPRYCEINSNFMVLLIEDVLNFYETGEKSFSGAQTLSVMKLREGIVKGMDKTGEWIEL